MPVCTRKIRVRVELHGTVKQSFSNYSVTLKGRNTCKEIFCLVAFKEKCETYLLATLVKWRSTLLTGSDEMRAFMCLG